MRLAALGLVLALGSACGVTAPDLPRVELPTFDTASVQRLIDDALAELGELTSTLPSELPPDVVRLLEENDIALPELPRNAEEICRALGTPGVSSVASAGLAQLIETLAAGAETGLVVGVVVVVVFRTCPVWMPHLEDALEQVL